MSRLAEREASAANAERKDKNKHKNKLKNKRDKLSFRVIPCNQRVYMSSQYRNTDLRTLNLS